MKGGEATPAPDSRAIQTKVRELRSATFSASRKGFDRDEVMTYLHRLASWLEGTGLADPDQVRRELAMVGQRTSEILTKAEDTANAMRTEAQRSAGEVLESARAEAERIRAEAAEEARQARAEADARAEEAVDEADRRAERMIDGAVKRRQDLEVLIDDLVAGRDEILADTRRLVEELRVLVERGAAGEPEESEEPEAAEEDGERLAELDDDGVLAEQDELDGEPDFSLREPLDEYEGDGAPDDLEPDTEEHSPERTSPGAP